MREAIVSASAEVVYLAPYSLDFNPIETVISKLKWHIQPAAKRTVEALWRAKRKTRSLDALTSP